MPRTICAVCSGVQTLLQAGYEGEFAEVANEHSGVSVPGARKPLTLTLSRRERG